MLKVSRVSLLVVHLQLRRDRSFLHVFRKVIGTPALARAGNEEPVVVESYLEAADLVVAVADLCLLLSLRALLVVERG